MVDSLFKTVPLNLDAIERDTDQSNFSMPSERKTGSLLRTLAAAKPNGRFLELGTGTGLSTAWILSGMDVGSSLISVDNEADAQEIARKYLGEDSRVTFLCEDGAQVIQNEKSGSFDCIFADAWPGKYYLLEETLDLLKIGGLYVIDDMNPQPNWPEGHDAKAAKLLSKLDNSEHLSVCRMQWATGIVICSRTA